MQLLYRTFFLIYYTVKGKMIEVERRFFMVAEVLPMRY